MQKKQWFNTGLAQLIGLFYFNNFVRCLCVGIEFMLFIRHMPLKNENNCSCLASTRRRNAWVCTVYIGFNINTGTLTH